MRDINKIILHCSDSEFGCAAIIKDWHTQKGWKDIGYHYVICNGKLYPNEDKEFLFDGAIETGRLPEVKGAHCKGQNKNSIGICLIGIDKFSSNQLVSLADLLEYLMFKYNLKPKDIYGHNQFSNKTCPNFKVPELMEAFFEEVE